MFLALLGLVHSACTATGPKNAGHVEAIDSDDADEVVVERSKARPPAWLPSPDKIGVLTDFGQDLRMVTMRNKLANLPLGLRQSQLFALDAMRLAIAQRLQSQLLAGETAPVIKPSAEGVLLREILACVEQTDNKSLHVADLYYEGVDNHLATGGDPLQHFYRVYVLVTVAKAQLPSLFSDLSLRLARSDDSAMRRLAESARQLAGQRP